MVVGSRLHNIKFVICPQNALCHSISFYIELEYCCPYMKRSTNRVTHILPVTYNTIHQHIFPVLHPSIPRHHCNSSSSSSELTSNEHRCTIHQHIFPGPHPSNSRHHSNRSSSSSELASNEHRCTIHQHIFPGPHPSHSRHHSSSSSSIELASNEHS